MRILWSDLGIFILVELLIAHMVIRTPTEVTLTEGEVPIWFGQMSWEANWLWILAALVFLLTIIGAIL
jgi:hypothetical protein